MHCNFFSGLFVLSSCRAGQIIPCGVALPRRRRGLAAAAHVRSVNVQHGKRSLSLDGGTGEVSETVVRSCSCSLDQTKQPRRHLPSPNVSFLAKEKCDINNYYSIN